MSWARHRLVRSLRRLSLLPWRQELLRAGLLVMDACVLAALFMPLNADTQQHSAGAAVAGLAGLILFAHVVLRWLSGTALTLAGQRLALLAVILGSAAVLTRYHVYAAYRGLDAAWIGVALSDWRSLSAGLTDAPIVLIVVLLCWWRGMRLNYRPLSLQSVALSFRVGVLWLLAAGLLWSPSRGFSVAVLIYGFFFCAILSMALARVDEIAEQERSDQPFGLGWLSIVLGSGAVAVGLGWVIARVYSPAGFRQVGEWLSPASRALGDLVYEALMWLGWLINPILEFLLRWLSRLLAVAWEGINRLEVFQFAEMTQPTPSPDQAVQNPFPWGEIILWSLVVLVVTLALAALVLSLRKMAAHRRPEREGDAHAILPAGLWADDLLDSLKSGVAHVAESLGLLRRFGLGLELYAALSIRNIYANLTRLAARRGFPRHVAWTPYEYVPTLRQAFPDAGDEITAITNAYVGVHYGETPSTLEELLRIRRYWDRIRSGLPKPDSQGPDQGMAVGLDAGSPTDETGTG